MESVSGRPDAFFRLSPAELVRASCFGVSRGEIHGRIDTNYWRLTPLVDQRFEKPRFEVKPLGGLLSLVQYGCSALAKAEPLGVPILRMNNLQNDGWDLSDLKYIELNEREFDSYRLVPDDLLFNRTNSKELVGKCEVFQESGDWVFASYLIRVRTNQSYLLPQFASDFLATKIGRLQIDRLSRQIIGMTNINAEEIRELRIPLPPFTEQKKLVARMDAARAERKAKLAEADALLTGVDNFLLDVLGITPPPEDSRRVFAVRLAQTRENSSLDADYYHPERILALRTLGNAARALTITQLAKVASFEREQVKTPGENYLSLAHVQGHTGELSDSRETANGTCFIYQTEDVLFARLRPYLNKVYRAEMDGCCSTEFHVLRVKNHNLLLPDYLAAVLRSRLILAQTTHMMTGNTHPRLRNDDAANLKIPIPKPEIQEAIVVEIHRRRDESRRLRVEAEADWKVAKRWFEEQLLGSAS